jgi:hypothetical protein
VDQKEFSERSARLQEIGKIIDQLPVEIRSEAFSLLKGYISGKAGAAVDKENAAEDENDGAELFTKFNHEKPSDNARLIAAYLFQEYGSEPFSIDEAKAVAARLGITIPDRIYMTFSRAAENGKQLFMRVGRGKFKPTVHGESYLKATYAVRKGTRTRNTEDA